MNIEISDNSKLSFNKWNKWTEKSKLIEFKCNKSGIGDGEYKIEKELNVKINGQNSCYDVDIIINNIKYKCDIKKLDHNTFNVGIIGKSKIQLIKHNLHNLFVCCYNIYNNSELLFSKEDREKILYITKINLDEICTSNIEKIKEVIKILNKKQKEIYETIDTYTIYDILTGEKNEVHKFVLYKLCSVLNKKIDMILSSCIKQIKLFENFDNTYIYNVNLFDNDLNNIKQIFINYILIFVDKVKGFYILQNPIDKIEFIRITRGSPRFIFKEHLQIL